DGQAGAMILVVDLDVGAVLSSDFDKWHRSSPSAIGLLHCDSGDRDCLRAERDRAPRARGRDLEDAKAVKRATSSSSLQPRRSQKALDRSTSDTGMTWTSRCMSTLPAAASRPG